MFEDIKVWTSKPTNFEDIVIESVDRYSRKEFFDLKAFSDKLIWGKVVDEDFNVGEDFIIDTPEVFALYTRYGTFIVRTEGYKYIRYIVEVEAI